MKPDQLVAKAKNVIATMFGTLDQDVLAHDFRFVAPVVGPLVGLLSAASRAKTLSQSVCRQGKEEFLRIFGSFKLEDALPDLQENHWGFHVDPLEPNRVWYSCKTECMHAPTASTLSPAVYLPEHPRKVHDEDTKR